MTSVSADQRSPRPLYLALGLVLLTLVVFGRCVAFDFVDWDDSELVITNPLLNPPTWSGVAEAWRGPVNKLYSPLAYNAWEAVAVVGHVPSVDAWGGHLNPMVFHTLNLLLHCGSVLAVFAILLQLADSPWAAAIGAAVFAIHPLQAEPVVWISGMNNVLAGLFVLIGVAAYIRFTRSPHPARWYAIAVVAVLAGLCSKPTAIAGPLMILALDAFILRRPLGKVLAAAAPLIVLAIPFVIIGRSAQLADEVVAPPMLDRLRIVIDSIGFYFSKAVWPHPLMFDYARPPAWVISHGPAAASIASFVLAGLLLLIALVRRWFRTAGVILIFAAGVLVVSGITPFAFQYYSTVADRYAYLAMLGVAIAVTLLLQRHGRRGVLAIAGAAVLLLAVVSFVQAGTWADTVTLTTHELKYMNNRSFVAHDMAAGQSRRNGDSAAAVAQLQQSLQIWPDNPASNLHLGLLLMDTEPADAIEHFYRAFHWGYREPKLLYPLGLTLMKSSRPADAEPILSELVERDPQNVAGFAMLGYAQAAMGEVSAAERSFRAAMQIDPTFPLAKSGLQRVLELKKTMPPQ